MDGTHVIVVWGGASMLCRRRILTSCRRLQELEATENAYETDIRATYRLFRNLENTIARFLIKAEKTETWAAAQLAVFQGAVYGDSLVATQTLLSAYATYEKQLGHFNEVRGSLSPSATRLGVHSPLTPPTCRFLRALVWFSCQPL